MYLQSSFGTNGQTEILWQCSSATCYLILFSENLQGWSSNSWSRWSFGHCSRVMLIIIVCQFVAMFHTEGQFPFWGFCFLPWKIYDFLGLFAIVKVSRHTRYMDKRASWSMEAHCRCCSCQRWSFLLSDLACWEGFKSRFVFDWDQLYIF